MKIIFNFYLLILISTSTNFSHAGEVNNSVITKLMIDINHGEKVFIKMDKEPSARPSCHTSPWSFVLPLSSEIHKNMYAMLLAAQTTSKSIDLEGYNQTCSVHSGIETLRRIEYE